VINQLIGIGVVDSGGIAHYAKSFQSMTTLALLRGRYGEQGRKARQARRVLCDVPFRPFEKGVCQTRDGTEEELFVIAETAETIKGPGYLAGDPGAQR